MKCDQQIYVGFKAPVSMDKCGEVDAVNGAGAPIGETDGATPENLWKENIT